MTILVIEDSRFLQLVIERVLVKAAYRVLKTSDGEDGLRVAKERVPDLILLDMMLPKLGGVNVLRALKNDPLTAKIPVIVLSGLSQMNEAKLLSEGAAAYLEKSSLGLDTGSDAFNDCTAREARRMAPFIVSNASRDPAGTPSAIACHSKVGGCA
jgi:CheY-like chemotaxis protein